MLVLNKLEFGNWFSYGPENTIILDERPLTQIKGPNGVGKTSIPIIIEELLTNSNSKGIKKTDLINRKASPKKLWAILYFSIGSDNYQLSMIRTSTVKLTLLKNGEDISSHTSKGTYDTLYELLPVSPKVLPQLIYQSSKHGLEFLKATDTARKRFLLEFFDQNMYTEIYEELKEIIRVQSKELATKTGAINTVQKWLDNVNSKNLEEEKELEVPTLDNSIMEEAGIIKSNIDNIDIINRKIDKNEKLKSILKELEPYLSKSKYKVLDNKELEDLQTEIRLLSEELTIQKRTLSELEKLYKLGYKCPTCNSTLNKDYTSELINEKIKLIKELVSKLQPKEKILNENKINLSKNEEISKKVREFEQNYSLVDNSLSSDKLDKDKLTKNLDTLRNKYKVAKATIDSIIAKNQIIAEHNAEIRAILRQIDEYNTYFNELSTTIEEIQEDLDILDIAQKIFNIKGLPSLKLDLLVDTLEKEINKYLGLMTSGRIFIDFVLEGDKLNIKILDNNDIISIEALSSGELSRVNVATVLAIRKLMSVLADYQINILFLDEITGTLDSEGKESLEEVLLQETTLNTFIVAHDHSSPLVPSINIEKENDISYISNG